jgi:hypothetical protein
VRNLPVFLALAALLLAPIAVHGEEEAAANVGGVATLTYRTHRDFDLLLPKEGYRPVGTAFPLAGCLGSDYAAKLDGTALAVDSDGDGTLDVRAEGPTALVTFRGKTTSGAPASYSVRLINAAGWKFAASGVMVGKLGETKVQLLDQNGNGRYDDYGEDAMIVGRGKHATWLSKAVSVAGKLYAIDVSPDGSRLSWKPFAGETGTLDLSGCETKAKVLSVVVRSLDGRYSFDMAKARGATVVPAGSYRIETGEIGLGTNRLKVGPGRMESIVVGKDAAAEVAWGGPVTAEFRVYRQGDQVGMKPSDVWYFGRSGEQYHTWFPTGESPTFTIRNADNGREITKAYFPGST